MPINEWSENIVIVELNDEPAFSEDMAGLMRRPVILDGRNIYSAHVCEEHGFERHGVGVPPVRGRVDVG